MQQHEITAGGVPSAGTTSQPYRAINVVAFLIFAVLWLAFGIALLISRGMLDGAWAALRELPLVVQAVVWLLLLPVVAGLWIWEQDWAHWVRLLLIAGLAVANLVTFYPWRSKPEHPATRST